MLTIGPQDLTLTTAVLASGSTSATLTAAWPSTSITCQQLVVFSNSEQRLVTFTQGSTTITWQSPTTSIQDSATISCVGVQSYPLPANISKIKNATITVGQLVYTPAPVMSIQEWTKLNALPYTSSIPAYFYIYNNQLNFWPIPSASDEIITLNCQVSVQDMTYEDNTTGTIASSGMVVGSNTVTGSGTTFTTSYMPTGVDLTFANLFIKAAPPQGDGLPYQIQSVTSDTVLKTFKPVVNVPKPTGGGTLLIGQYPLLSPDFHDTIVYGALRVYFASIVPDPNRYKLYDTLYNEKLQLIEFYLANKSVNVDLGDQPEPRNPNLFWQGVA